LRISGDKILVESTAVVQGDFTLTMITMISPQIVQQLGSLDMAGMTALYVSHNECLTTNQKKPAFTRAP